MTTTPAQAERKATNLQRKLSRKYSGHSLQLLVIAYTQGEDIVVKVSSDVDATLVERDWFHAGLIAADLYRLATGMVDRAVTAAVTREAEYAAWLTEAAKTAHP